MCVCVCRGRYVKVQTQRDCQSETWEEGRRNPYDLRTPDVTPSPCQPRQDKEDGRDDWGRGTDK